MLQGEPSEHGVLVASSSGGELAQRWQIHLDGAHQPSERLGVSGEVLDHSREAGDVSDSCVQLLTAPSDVMEARRVGWLETAEETGDPTGYLPHRRCPSVRRHRHNRWRFDAAERPQVAGQGAVAAGVPPPADFNQ